MNVSCTESTEIDPQFRFPNGTGLASGLQTCESNSVMRAVLPIALVLALIPAAASAVTVQEIVALSKAGVSEPVILALIDRDKTIYALGADELVALSRNGLSEAIMLSMLRSGRQEPPPQEPAPVAPEPVYTEPNVVVVGHGPERPNAADPYAASAAAYPVPYAVPYLVPYLVSAPPVQSPCFPRSVGTSPAFQATTGQFFANTIQGQFFSNTPTGQFFVHNGVSQPIVGAVQQPVPFAADCFQRQGFQGARVRRR